LVWAREERPDMRIDTKIVKYNDVMAIVKATISDASGQPLATAHKKETKSGFGDYLEKAETGSIGRALAMVGYGTQFAPEFEEGERLADSPINAKEPTTQAPVVKSASESQRKMYFAVAKTAGYSATQAKAIAKKAFNLDSFTDINFKQCNTMINTMNTRIKQNEEKMDDFLDDLPDVTFDEEIEDLEE